MIGSNARSIALSYRSLATMNDAGQPLPTAIENIQSSASERDRRTLARILLRVRRGSFLNLAMRAESFPPLDVALIQIGEKTGTLSEICRYLCNFYEQRYEVEKSVRKSLTKPALIASLSLFLRELPGLVGGTVTLQSYLLHALGSLTVVALLFLGARQVYRKINRSGRLSEQATALFKPVPWLGRVLNTIALERFFTILNLGLASGLDLGTMLELGAATTSLRPLKRKTAGILNRAQKIGLASSFQEAGLFTSEQILILRTGEQAGQLEEALKKMSEDLRTELKNDLQNFADWLPKIVYAFAMLYALSGIVSSYQTMFKEQEKLLHLDDPP